jgi:hypothetical protein
MREHTINDKDFVFPGGRLTVRTYSEPGSSAAVVIVHEPTDPAGRPTSETVLWSSSPWQHGMAPLVERVVVAAATLREIASALEGTCAPLIATEVAAMEAERAAQQACSTSVPETNLTATQMFEAAFHPIAPRSVPRSIKEKE